MGRGIELFRFLVIAFISRCSLQYKYCRTSSFLLIQTDESADEFGFSLNVENVEGVMPNLS